MEILYCMEKLLDLQGLLNEKSKLQTGVRSMLPPVGKNGGR